MDKPDTLRIAAIQMCSRQNRAENLTRAENLLRNALQHRPHLIALPENFSFLDREGNKLTVMEELDNGPSIQMLQHFARTHNVMIVGGSLPLRSNKENRVTNTCLVFDIDGSIVARYDKIHLFDINLDAAHSFQESRYIAPGSNVVTFNCLDHTMGLSICYDVRFPELYRKLAMQGACVFFVPSAFTHRTGTDHWEILLRTRAIENLSYVVAPAQVGRHNEHRESYGRSMIIDPWGQILAQAADRDCVITADLNFSHLNDVRQRLPCLEHTRLL